MLEESTAESRTRWERSVSRVDHTVNPVNLGRSTLLSEFEGFHKLLGIYGQVAIFANMA
jgi:hypothetical protein